MRMMDSFEPIEKYSSFKKRKFNEYESKIDRILQGIYETSFKSEDKENLRLRLAKKLNDFCDPKGYKP